eukprot:765833_1
MEPCSPHTARCIKRHWPTNRLNHLNMAKPSHRTSPDSIYSRVSLQIKVFFVAVALTTIFLASSIRQMYTFTIYPDTPNQITTTELIIAMDINTTQSTPSIGWEEAMKQRETMPSKCNDSSRNILEINPTSNNWAPYWYRCDIIKRPHKAKYPRANGDVYGQVFISKELGYVHVFKAGGSTIQSGLDRLSKNQSIMNVTAYDESRSSKNYVIPFEGLSLHQLLDFINDQTFVFTFIRDPISKFLSGFFEISRRRQSAQTLRLKRQHVEKMEGIDVLRLWIKAMLRNKRHHPTIPKMLRSSNFLDKHTAPNVNFMYTYRDLFNFVGVINNVNNDMPQVLQSFVVDEEVKNDPELLMSKYFIHQNARTEEVYSDKFVRKYHINVSEINDDKFNFNILDLSDKDIHNLCEIYWLEYICFPWDVPPACNLAELFMKHYDKFVRYKPCY